MPKTTKSKPAAAAQNAPTASPAAPVPAQPQAPPAGKPTPTPAPNNNGNGAKPNQTNQANPATSVDQGKPIHSVAEHFPGAEGQDVTFKFTAPNAKDVKVAGSFNNWHPDTTSLKKSGAGEWTTQVKLRSGKYEYRFVVDGKWCEDPHATQRGVNPYGGFNSILNVQANGHS